MSQQIIIQPDATAGVDTYIQSDVSGSNFGTNQYLSSGTAQVGKVWAHARTLIRFDLRSLIGVASIDYAELKFTGFNHLASPQTFYVCRPTRTNWTELGATWNKYDGTNNWTTAGGDYTTDKRHSLSVSVAAVSPFVFSSNDAGMGETTGILLLTRDAITLYGGYLDLFVIGPETNANNSLTFASSNNSTASDAPKMAINFTPAIHARRNRSYRVASRGAV